MLYNTQRFDDYAYMGICLSLARKAAALGEVPVGAIVVHRPSPDQAYIIGRGFNLRESTQDPSAHAEVIALRQASQTLGYWRMVDCDLYVTLEPCIMCTGALVNSRIERVIYGCQDPKAGACHSLYQIPQDHRLNHRYPCTPNIRADESRDLLQSFFRACRQRKKRARKDHKRI